MLDYRDQGLTEAKIADKLTIIFMRKFTQEAVNRKIRDLKRSGYIEQNEHTGRYSNPLGIKREGENYERNKKADRKAKSVRKSLQRRSRSWDGKTGQR